jgi:hypothetical protein
VLLVSVSGYHEHLARRRNIDRRRHLSEEALLVHIRAVYAAMVGPTAGRASGGSCGLKAFAWASSECNG